MLSRLLPSDARARQAIYAAIAVVATLVVTQFVLPGSEGGGRGTPGAIMFKGVALGLILAVFTVSVILVYRTVRVINFCQGPVGVVAVGMAFGFIRWTEIPFVVAILLGLLSGVVVGAGIGLLMLRFHNSSRLFLAVVTVIASGAVLALVTFAERAPWLPSPDELTSTDVQLSVEQFRRLFPLAGFRFQIGGFPLKYGFIELFGIELALVGLVGILLFLRFSRYGIAMRGMAENPERAALLGIGVGGLTVLVWALAGLLDSVAIISAGATSVSLGGGFTALLPIFACAVLARFDNLATGVFVAMIVGLTREAFLFSYADRAELYSVFLFVLIGLGLLFQRRRQVRSEVDVSWAGAEEPRAVPRELSSVTGLRLARWGVYSVVAAAVVLFPFIASTNRTFLITEVMIYTIAVLSLVVLTGWAGQVSLGQYAFVAVGAVVGGSLTSRAGISFWLAVPIVVALCAGLAAVVGLPALRLKGLFLLVLSFAFAVAVSAVLFDETYFGWLLPAGVDRPTLFFLNFDEDRSMYFLAAACLTAAILVVRNLRRSRVGRVLIALRENETNLAALGVTVVRAKILAFAISGALCGFAGILVAHQQRGVTADSFTADASVYAFINAVLGGVSSPLGAVLGAFYSVLVRNLLGNNVILQTFFSFYGPLLIVIVAPGGLVSVVNKARDSVLRIIAQRRRIVVPSLFADYDADALERRLIPLADPDHLSGLAALPIDERFAYPSELYAGTGERVIDKLGPAKETVDHAALSAAARSVEDLETVGALPTGSDQS